MGPDSFVGTANLGQSPARSARRSNPVRRRKGSSERVDRIGSILPARETALRCGSPDVSRADQCDGLTARDARPRGLFHPSLDAQSLGQTPQHRIEVMARALAATAAVSRDRLLRSEEHTSELQSLMSISYAVSYLKTQNKNIIK